MSNDIVVYEDLQVQNLIKNHYLAKSIADASWSLFTQWLDYYGKVWDKVVVAVPPQYTTQDCSYCGHRVPKSLSTRTHVCPKCQGVEIDRDENAALNLVKWYLTTPNSGGSHACGDSATGVGSPTRYESLNQEGNNNLNKSELLFSIV